MKTILDVGAPFLVALTLQGRDVTLTINTKPADGPIIPTNSLSIGPNEALEVVALNGVGVLDIAKGKKVYSFRLVLLLEPANLPYSEISPVTGPATVTLRRGDGFDADAAGYCTIRVSPAAFNAEETVLVPPGANCNAFRKFMVIQI